MCGGFLFLNHTLPTLQLWNKVMIMMIRMIMMTGMMIMMIRMTIVLVLEVFVQFTQQTKFFVITLLHVTCDDVVTSFCSGDPADKVLQIVPRNEHHQRTGRSDKVFNVKSVIKIFL